MGDEEFIHQLRSTRDDYKTESKHHRFLLDAYAGTGGFRGRDQQTPSSFWGAAADMYGREQLPLAVRDASPIERKSYLDRFPREDDEKFRRRVMTAQYINHVATAVDIPLSFMARQIPGREDMAPQVDAWMKDVDGNGTSWDEMLHETIQPRAAVVGYCPVLFDLPSAPTDENGERIDLTLAQAREEGMQLTAIPLFPIHLLKWSTDRNGRFRWVKVRIYEELPTPLGATEVIEKITVWYPDRAETWTIRRNAEGRESLEAMEPEVFAHDFGKVPIAVARWKPIEGDSVRGISMIESIAQAARRGFNYHSELDEHIRSCVFSVMQVPRKNVEQQGGAITLGNGNALAIDPQSRQKYEWVSPPIEPAEILEKRIKENRREIYRLAKVEFALGGESGSGGGAKSGIARAFEFENTNRAISDFARRDARFQERAFDIAAHGLPGVPPEGDDKARVVPPSKFAVEELLTKLEEAAEAIDLDLGPTAEKLIKLRIVAAVLPNLSDEDRETIESEIEERIEEKNREATLLKQQLVGGPDDDEDDPEDDPDEDGPPVPPEPEE